MTEQQLHDALSQNALLLTANSRLLRSWRQSYADHQRAQGRLAWPSPSIRTWDSWVLEAFESSLSASAVLTPFAELRLWQSVIAGLEGDAALLDMEATASAAAHSRSLCHQYLLPLSHPSFSDTADSERFRLWASEFDSQCRARGFLTGASLDSWFAASLSAASPLTSRQLILTGFDEIIPSRRAVLDALSSGAPAHTVYTPQSPQSGSAFRAAFQSPREELYAAACWARQLLENGQASSVGVVVVNLADLSQSVAPLFSSVLGAPLCNVSLGLPLAQWPLAAAAIGWLRWLARPLPIADAGILLRSPYLAGAIEEFFHRSRLEFSLAEGNANQPSLAFAETRAAAHDCPALARHIAQSRAAFELLPRRQTPASWARSFHALLQAAGWPGDRTLDSAEAQALQAWHAVLREFAALDPVEGPIDFRHALRLLESLSAAEIFQPETPPVPVQVLDPLQAAGARFDALWIAGCDDSRWPAPARPDPFLPRSLQRQHNLPASSPQRALDFARLVTARLLASAPHAVFSHATAEKDRQLRPSPLILGFPPLASPPSAYPTPARHQFRTGEFETFEDTQAPPLPPGVKAAGGASILNAQSACPFRAFALHRLRAVEWPVPIPGLTPSEQGDANHAALAALWREFPSRADLLAASPEIREAVLVRSIDAAYANIPSAGRRKLIAIDKLRLRSLLDEWLEVDLDRPNFTIAAVEQPRDPFVPIRQLRADRIDRLDDGSEILIDYKSTSPGKNAWAGPRPEDLQLPLYALSAPAPPAAIVFAQLKPGGCKWDGVAAEEGLLPRIKPPGGVDWPSQLESWRTIIEGLWSEFQAGHAAVDPNLESAPCGSCHLHSLCRIAGSSPASEDPS